jgi:hypothetical protein
MNDKSAPPTVRTLQLQDIGDVIDSCTIHLLRVEALVRAILCGAECCIDPEQLGTLADLCEDTAHEARSELDAFWESLTAKKEARR